MKASSRRSLAEINESRFLRVAKWGRTRLWSATYVRVWSDRSQSERVTSQPQPALMSAAGAWPNRALSLRHCSGAGVCSLCSLCRCLWCERGCCLFLCAGPSQTRRCSPAWPGCCARCRSRATARRPALCSALPSTCWRPHRTRALTWMR